MMFTSTIAMTAMLLVAPAQQRSANFTVSVRVVNSCHVGLADLTSGTPVASSNLEPAANRRVGCRNETPIRVDLSVVAPARPAHVQGGYNLRDQGSSLRPVSVVGSTLRAVEVSGATEIIRVGSGYVESNQLAASLAELAERTARTRPDASVMATIQY